MSFTARQEKIINIVKEEGPITGEQIAQRLNLTRATLRPDLAILTMSGVIEARPNVGYYYIGKAPKIVVKEHLSKTKVKDIKSMPVVVRESTSVYDAIVTMFLEDVGSLIVVGEEGSLEGIVSRKDLLKVAMGYGDLHKIPVGVIMTRRPNLVTVSPEDSVVVAAGKIIEYEVDSLPVVRPREGPPGGDGKEQLEVVGRISKTNIVRLFVELSEGKD